MATDAPAPGLSSDAPSEPCGRGACPHCGHGAGVIADPAPGDMTALGELIEIGMVVARALGRQVAATGIAGLAEGAMFDTVARGVRRTAALRKQLHTESLKSAEQRHAENLRRIEAQVREQVRVRQKMVRDALTAEVTAEVERRGEPTDRENLLADMHEQLLDADIAAADTPMKISAIILDICKDLGITPRNHIWSDALMRHEIHAMKVALDDAVADRTPPAGASMEPPKPEPWGNGEEVKIGSVTFNPDGSFKCRDYDPPESEWPPEILNHPPVDIFALREKNKPPNTE